MIGRCETRVSMDGGRRSPERLSKAACRGCAVAVLAVVLLLFLSGIAAADVSTDISDATWETVYHVSPADVHQLAQGFPDGTFRPEQKVTRGQFAKMSVNAFGFMLWYYPEPLFSDVPPDHFYYPYVMGVSFSSSFMGGYLDGTFRPDMPITRGEACGILGQWVRSPEDIALGGIQGVGAIYASIPSWFRQEGEAMFDQVADHESVSPNNRPVTAYLFMRGVVQGSGSRVALYLKPQVALTRAQTVTLLLRARAMAYGVVPTVTGVSPTTGPAAGGTTVVITGTGFSPVSGEFEYSTVAFGGTAAASYTIDSPTQITAVTPPQDAGTVYVRVKNGGGGTSAMVPGDEFTYTAGP